MIKDSFLAKFTTTAPAMGLLCLLVGAISPAGAQTASGGPGYKGVPWGTPCAKALDALQGKGIRFYSHKMEEALQGRAEENALALAPSETTPGGRCGILEVTTRAFKSEYPYAEITGSAGLVTAAAYCRAGKFVGITFSAYLDQQMDAVAFLRQAAGEPTSTRTVAPFGGQQVIRISGLAPREDSVRYLLSDVTTISPDPRKIEYVVMARTENEAVQRAQLDCTLASNELERHKAEEEKKRARSAVE